MAQTKGWRNPTMIKEKAKFYIYEFYLRIKITLKVQIFASLIKRTYCCRINFYNSHCDFLIFVCFKWDILIKFLAETLGYLGSRLNSFWKIGDELLLRWNHIPLFFLEHFGKLVFAICVDFANFLCLAKFVRKKNQKYIL